MQLLGSSVRTITESLWSIFYCNVLHAYLKQLSHFYLNPLFSGKGKGKVSGYEVVLEWNDLINTELT